ncbi:histone-lysine N-methyltransferase EZA1 [Chenopodium quinoa]|uniref:histone-lysine N-methyltransferase EZA1 n=1 Tax=Chenopodium quinoa TaxID=63459 RepID=UPI000B76FD9A|nr:histone-lysine N-methyltransferase EZA1 [Chenopodium quinoa]XP_021768739.1 histone-lysine N-methyltransferase EZA1 [Chenopodium quinoa]XP_021768740.1 histone-lysine N-methyltransferase EZA1 [Chenopodium quinoa]XP_021768741.1 histone-lysine N-methyltransferase EZA1 [Chenopodium quinoa]XP_021768742.1 histone-lysine N-methyltransferase EZA1 [Chenopodium quinoa]
MVSGTHDSLSKPKASLKDLMERGYGNLIKKIYRLKEEIEADREVKIKEKLDKCLKKLQSHIHGGMAATFEGIPSAVRNEPCEIPRLGNETSLSMMNGYLLDSADKGFVNVHEVISTKSIKLPRIQRIPTYTTWVFLDRNQRMVEDQSIVGRRRIYYDQSGKEALVCSDSEEDVQEAEVEKRDFSDGEDRILWMAFQEHGLDDDVAEVVSHFVGGTPVEIQERYNELKLKLEASEEQDSSGRNMFLEKSLSACLDSFDYLFCRRCLAFDCRSHGCSQPTVNPREKLSSLPEPEGRKPCSDQCYLLAIQTAEELVESSDSRLLQHMDHAILEEESRGSSVFNCEVNISSADFGTGCTVKSDTGEGSTAGVLSGLKVVPTVHANVAKRKITDDNGRELERSGSFESSINKKLTKIQAVESTTVNSKSVSASAISSGKSKKLSVESSQYLDHQQTGKHPMEGHATGVLYDLSSDDNSSCHTHDIIGEEVRDISRRVELKQPVSLGRRRTKLSSSCDWKPLEKSLLLEGLKMFGKSSCLIARNFLPGLKTCSEVSSYLQNNRALLTQKMDKVNSSEDNRKEIVVRPRSRIVRKRGRARRLKFSTKSNGHPSSLKKDTDANKAYKLYTPCSCESVCGKDCSCISSGNCCEKYCGCPKGCKNRFRGCHCAKSQCRSRQCPCFAANRECDPDVCRNCWVSCGGGELGEPPKRGDGQCGNMRLLLRQQQRILLGRSDVVGWGAFIKNTVNKNDYLGEYTGELISHQEADKRGKIYDRVDSSYLFDLNDHYVLDACRRGDKLKFANHSATPNCYCKILLVGGDHRVGIFAGERIEAMQEIFYDYRYGPDQAPSWFRRSKESKKDEQISSQSRARKHQSR